MDTQGPEELLVNSWFVLLGEHQGSNCIIQKGHMNATFIWNEKKKN